MIKKKHSLTAIALVFAMLLQFSAFAPMVKADTASGITTTITLTDGGGNTLDENATHTSPIDITNNKSPSVTVDFMLTNLSDSINKDDTYTIKIPDQIKITDSLVNPDPINDPQRYYALNDISGNLVANATINSDGTVTFIFTDYEKTYSQPWVDFKITSTFDPAKITNANPAVLDFVTSDSTIPISLNFTPLANVIINKTASAYDTKDNTINWTVDVNPNKLTVDNAAFSDDILKGQQYVPKSLTVTKVASPNNIVTFSNDDSCYTADNSGGSKTGSLSYSLGDIQDEYIITYTTNVTDSDAYTTAGGTERDTAHLEYNDYFTNSKTDIDSPEVDVLAKIDLIDKDGAQVGDSNVINWTITVDADGKTLTNKNGATGPTVSDVIPSDLTLDTGSVVLNDGTKDTSLVYNTDFTYDPSPGANTFSYDFPTTISKKYTIKFSTTVNNDVYFCHNNNTNDNDYDATESDSNIANIVGANNGNPIDVNSVPAVVNVTSHILSKSGTYNPSTHCITWRLTLDSNAVSMTGVTVTDVLPAGLSFDDSTGNKNPNFEVDNVPTTGYSITNGTLTDDKLTYTFTGTIASQQTVTFNTYVTEPTIYAVNNTFTSYDNGGSPSSTTLDYTINTVAYTQNTSATCTVNSHVISKSCSYNAITKKLTWSIVVNANKMPLSSVVVTDTIPAGQDYDYDYNPTTGSRVTVTRTSGTTDSNSLDLNNVVNTSYTPNNASDNTAGGTLIYTFPGTGAINDQYTITLVTDVTNLSVFYANVNPSFSNSAYLSDTLVPYSSSIPTVKNSVTATASHSVPNYFTKKDSTYTGGNNYIDWSVQLNSNALPLTSGTLTDQIPDGLTLQPSSVVLSPETIDASGAFTNGTALTLNSSNVTYSTSGLLTITLPANTTSTAYYLTYRTYITNMTKTDSYNSTTKTGNAINTITFSGNYPYKSSSYSLSSIKSLTNIWSSTADGSGGGVLGSLTITKVDAENTSIKLANAYFELLDGFGNIVRGPTATDSNGNVTFTDLLYGTYTIVETATPLHYILGTTQPVTISSADNTCIYADKVEKGTITVAKQDDSGKPLGGAVFALCNTSGTPIGSITATSDNTTGIATFLNVPLGSYKVKETTAPSGYLVNPDISNPITIDDNDYSTTQIAKDSSTNNPYFSDDLEGVITVTKVDASYPTEKLDGATFNLYDNTTSTNIGSFPATVVGTTAFSNLPYGDYTVTETGAPSGYTAASPQPVDIAQGDTQKTCTFGDTFVNGKITLTKTDVSTPAKPLVGAIFDLYDTTTSTDIGSFPATAIDGTTSLSNLQYGTYTVKETKAPAGYHLNSTPKTVTIAWGSNSTQACTFTDYLIVADTGSIKITKTDSSGNPLAGAGFTLYDSTGTAVQTNTSASDGTTGFYYVPIGKYTVKETLAPQGYLLGTNTPSVSITSDNYDIAQNLAFSDDKDGVIVVTKTDDSASANKLDGATFELLESTGKEVGNPATTVNGIVSFSDLQYGTYTVKETVAPDGYTLAASQSISIVQGSTQKKCTVVDSKTMGTIQVDKTDSKGNPLAGAVFTLYDSSKNMVSTATSNASGVAEFDKVQLGNYTIAETATPKGYLFNSNTPSISITSDNYATTQIVPFSDDKQGVILITKTDASNSAKKLAGATFELLNTTGTEIGSPVTTGTDGIASFSGLKYGTYTVKETVAPNGYELNAAEQTIQIALGKTQATCKFADEIVTGTTVVTGTIEVTEVYANGKPIIGTKFTLYDGNGKAIQTVVSSSDGTAKFTAVTIGKYSIRETGAPTTTLNNSTQSGSFTTSNYNRIQKYKLVVPSKYITNPDTSDHGNSIPIIPIAILVLCSSGIAIIKCSEKRRLKGRYYFIKK